MEEIASDRSYDTWFERANDRLSTFGTEVLYLVSDRAKALIKLAHTGFGCPSIHRGLPTRRYRVWTVLHNFDCRAADGTTPASRFFRPPFPDLFESVLSQIDELPMPR
jgi:hypothetical protein